MQPIDGVQRATGRDRAEWFRVLDDWGAAGRDFREIAGWLMGEHDLSKWWAQKLIVEYEQARGLRPPGVRPNGKFEISASKTIGVPVQPLFAAFVDSRQRRRWLRDGKMTLRSSQPGHSARFDWEDGSSRVNIGFIDKGPSKSAVAVVHERLGDVDEAQAMKAMWKKRLAELKSILEG